MDTERDLLFGIVAFQNGAVDADRLAETYAAWATEPSLPLAEHFVDCGVITAEQRTEVEKVVAHELEAHGGDPHATLAATMDGRSMAAIRNIAGVKGALEAKLVVPQQLQGGHVVLGTLTPHEPDNRERYTLTHLHAKGGMGRVWLARDTALGRQIALKELRPDQTDNSIVFSRFLYEAKITAQLEHPGIVPVYELGEGEAPYYTMRFVKGRTLSEAIRAYHKKRAAGEGRPSRPGRALDGVCRGLSCGSLRAFAWHYPPRSEGAECRSGRFRRGHGARLGPRQARRSRPAGRQARPTRRLRRLRRLRMPANCRRRIAPPWPRTVLMSTKTPNMTLASADDSTPVSDARPHSSPVQTAARPSRSRKCKRQR